MSPLLRVTDLSVEFRTSVGTVHAVDGLSFDVDEGEVFAIVGESGCGKTAAAMSILQLLPVPEGRVTSGRAELAGVDLLSADARTLRSIRGDRVGVVFQDPLTALNPVQRIGDQIAEVFRAHRDVGRREARERAVELLGEVGIPQPVTRSRDYPHQFSGGMRQRVVLAMAIALRPALLIADEPTTGLDVTIQAQILALLLDVRRRYGMSIVLITHDLGVVAGTADRVMVMYAGRKAEEASTERLFAAPKHPYTWGLLAATTRVDRPIDPRLARIPGAPPDLRDPPPACRFAPRCAHAKAVCTQADPATLEVGGGHVAACHFAHDDGWEAPWNRS